MHKFNLEQKYWKRSDSADLLKVFIQTSSSSRNLVNFILIFSRHLLSFCCFSSHWLSIKQPFSSGALNLFPYLSFKLSKSLNCILFIWMFYLSSLNRTEAISFHEPVKYEPVYKLTAFNVMFSQIFHLKPNFFYTQCVILYP